MALTYWSLSFWGQEPRLGRRTGLVNTKNPSLHPFTTPSGCCSRLGFTCRVPSASFKQLRDRVTAHSVGDIESGPSLVIDSFWIRSSLDERGCGSVIAFRDNLVEDRSVIARHYFSPHLLSAFAQRRVDFRVRI